MKTLSSLLDRALTKRELSLRTAAQQIGVSHMTVVRILEGRPVDVDTLISISNWLGVRPSTVLDAEGIGKDAFAAKVTAILETNPALAEVFKEAIDRVEVGEISQQTFEDLAAYAAYRINLDQKAKEKDAKEELQASNSRGSGN